MLELVRYIHLNPFRGHLVETIDALDRYRWAGHAVLLGRRPFAAQDREFVLRHFGANTRRACRAYWLFIEEGARRSSPVDLSGGGLRRSIGGWKQLSAVRRGRERWAFDERILGGSDFVQEVLAETECPEVSQNSAVRLSALCSRVAESCQLNESEVLGPSLRRPTVKARTMVSFIAVREYGLSLSTVARHLGVSPQSVARGVAAGEFLLRDRTSLVNRLSGP